MIAAVERTSAPSPAPLIRVSPSASAASISARWLIDLSPGTRSSPRRRALPRTRATRGCEAGGGGVDPISIASPFRRVDAADVRMQRDDRGHHVAELVEGELLLGIGQGVIGARVDLDHDPIRTDRDAAQSERLDRPTLAGGMARGDGDGEGG